MKKLIYLLFFCISASQFLSCKQDIDFPYQGKDRIQFEHYTTSNNTRTYFNKINHSLGLLADTVKMDTARIVVTLLGKIADYDRQYQITINADSTSAVEGVHYKPFSMVQTLEAGKYTDTIMIEIIRKDLSISYQNPEDKNLYLTLIPSEDFDLGLTKGLSMKVVLNNYLVEPAWWEKNFLGALQFYHPEKWKMLIRFNKDFANYNDVPFRQGTFTGNTFVTQLEYYLRIEKIYDQETGERVYMDKLVVEE